MKKFRDSFLLVSGLFMFSSLAIHAEQQHAPPDLPVDELISRVAENESRLREEFKTFMFTQDLTVQTLRGPDVVTGEMRRISKFIFTDKGSRVERITYFPPSTLGVRFTQADYNDLAGTQPFALSKEELHKYRVSYIGRERIDELDTYVLDVTPVRPPNPKKLNDRFFKGRVWVDTVDLVVVKAAGQGLPEDENNQFPKFETWRENIAKGIWFPTYTYADDILDFKTGRVHIRMVVRITDYKRFSGGIKILSDDEILPEENPPSKPEPGKKPRN